MSRVTIIVAVDLDGVIGRDGALPWKLSADLRSFRRATMGKPIVMGRKTHQSIGRPLDGRTNIVLSRNPDLVAEGCTVVGSVPEALDAAGDASEVMVIGGASVYRAFLPVATRLLLTRVHAHVEGDAHFPPWDESQWEVVDSTHHDADAKNQYSFEVLDMRRVSS